LKRSRTPKSAPVLPIPPEKADGPEIHTKAEEPGAKKLPTLPTPPEKTDGPEIHTEAEEPGAKKRPTLPTPPEKTDGPEVHTETEEPPTDEKEPPAGGSCTFGKFLTSWSLYPCSGSGGNSLL
jgi:hypothetical protein